MSPAWPYTEDAIEPGLRALTAEPINNGVPVSNAKTVKVGVPVTDEGAADHQAAHVESSHVAGQAPVGTMRS